MPKTTTTLGDVLTLSEAASLLRVADAPLAELAAGGAIPARKIGEEWRFSTAAILHWLDSGPGCQHTTCCLPSCCSVEARLLDKLASLFEQRMGDRQEMTPPPGSKEAVRKCIGIFEKYGDLDKELAQLAAIRNSGSAEVGE